MTEIDDFDPIDDPIDDVDDTPDNGGEDTNNGEDHGVGTSTNMGDDGLSVSDDELKPLQEKSSDIDRSDADKSQISFGRKMCPTRHGCQGATNCDYSYGGYPG